MESNPLFMLQKYDYFGNLPKKTESICTFYNKVVQTTLKINPFFLNHQRSVHNTSINTHHIFSDKAYE